MVTVTGSSFLRFVPAQLEKRVIAQRNPLCRRKVNE
jgi:hypothetical protein